MVDALIVVARLEHEPVPEMFTAVVQQRWCEESVVAVEYSQVDIPSVRRRRPGNLNHQEIRRGWRWCLLVDPPVVVVTFPPCAGTTDTAWVAFVALYASNPACDEHDDKSQWSINGVYLHVRQPLVLRRCFFKGGISLICHCADHFLCPQCLVCTVRRPGEGEGGSREEQIETDMCGTHAFTWCREGGSTEYPDAKYETDLWYS